jgi:hypothetical protein
MFICLLVTTRVLLKKQKVAITAIVLIGAMAYGSGPWVGLITTALVLFLLLRFGLLFTAAFIFAYASIESIPMTLQPSAWYSGYSYLALTIYAAIVLYAFRASLGGRPLLATSHLDD